MTYKILKDFCRWPDEPIEEMDSTLAVQQFIQQTIRRDPSNLEAILKMPEAQDEGVWKYEHLRSLFFLIYLFWCNYIFRLLGVCSMKL